jgi:hypothetical protein
VRASGEAALAHANRGRPSPRRLPDAVRRRILQLARGTYAGFIYQALDGRVSLYYGETRLELAAIPRG